MSGYLVATAALAIAIMIGAHWMWRQRMYVMAVIAAVMSSVAVWIGLVVAGVVTHGGAS